MSAWTWVPVTVMAEGEATPRRVDGLVSDDAPGLAITHALQGQPDGLPYALTHRMSGQRIRSYPSLEVAQRAALRLASLTDWRQDAATLRGSVVLAEAVGVLPLTSGGAA